MLLTPANIDTCSQLLTPLIFGPKIIFNVLCNWICTIDKAPLGQILSVPEDGPYEQ